MFFSERDGYIYYLKILFPIIRSTLNNKLVCFLFSDSLSIYLARSFDSINSCFLVLIMHSCLSHSTYHMDTWSFAGAPSTTREHVDTIVVYCTTSSVYFDGYHSPVSGGESKQHATRLAQAISAEPQVEQRQNLSDFRCPSIKDLFIIIDTILSIFHEINNIYSMQFFILIFCSNRF